MNLILLLGTSSVGKSTLCQAMQAVDEDIIVAKNCDDYLEAQLSQFEHMIQQSAHQSLLRYMDVDEVIRYCMTQQFNMRKSDSKIQDVKIKSEQDLVDILKTTNLEPHIQNQIVRDLTAVKAMFEQLPRVDYDTAIQQAIIEAELPENSDKTVIIDLVPESSPEQTQAVIDNISKRVGHAHVQTILLYAPMSTLVSAMARRNISAEANHRIYDKRVSLNPLMMFSSVATADPSAQQNPALSTESKQALEQIIEGFVTPDERAQMNAWLCGEGDGQWIYGFRFPEGSDEVQLHVPKSLQFDAVICNDFSQDPKLLAEDVMGQLGLTVRVNRI